MFKRPSPVLALLVVLGLALPASVCADTSYSGGSFSIGVNAHLATGAGLEKMTAMGASSVRADAIWSNIERTKGIFDFAALDAFVAQARAQGLSVYLNLAGTPAWETAGGRYQAVPRVTDWTNFVSRVARRYGTRVALYEIWNEPNIPAFFDGSPAQYLQTILKPGYLAIKAVNSRLIVAGPEVTITPTVDPRPFLAVLTRSNGLHYADVVSFHAYAGDLTTFRSLVSKILAVLPSGKPIYLTEFGWDAKTLGEAVQASRLASTIAYLAGLGRIRVALIYELIDDPTITAYQLGLLRSDGSARPAVAAVRKAIAHYRR